MFLRRYERRSGGRNKTYWALVESVRTGRGSRQRAVAYLGELARSERSGWAQLGRSLSGRKRSSPSLFDPPHYDDPADDEPVLVELRGVRLERLRDFGDVWMAWGLWRLLGLDTLLQSLAKPRGEDVPWPVVAAILTIARFCKPSSELHIETTWYRATALEDLLGVAVEKVHTDRLYEGLDWLSPPQGKARLRVRWTRNKRWSDWAALSEGCYPEQPPMDAIEACVVHDDLEPAGDFACSNELLNRLHANCRWGIRGNYRSIPTDCPQRDERQGWTGDRALGCRGEMQLFDLAAFYEKWTTDMADAQLPDGKVSDVCPAYWPIYKDNVTWEGTIALIPNVLREQDADERFIVHITRPCGLGSSTCAITLLTTECRATHMAIGAFHRRVLS